MNRELVENILAVLKTSTDKGVVIKGLVKLRTDVVKDHGGIVLFRLAGGVPPMVRFLNKPHEQILEVALSILGNCCTDEASCQEALQCKVALPLATILKSIPNPVIQCRACRLLGNLAKDFSSQLLATHCPAIAQSVCQIITETSDVNTRMMAFRACRFMLPNATFLQHFLSSKGFVILTRILAAVMKKDTQAAAQEEELLKDNHINGPAVGLKNSQHREKYFEEVARNLEGVRSDIFDHEMLKNQPRASNAYEMPKEKAALDLACEMLKSLLVLSELQINMSFWKDLIVSGGTFAPVTFLASEDNKHRSVALKILSNFSKQFGAFVMLSSADAVVAACELLVAGNLETPLTENEKRHCINIICMLSPDACNRSKIRRAGALRKLIDMVRNSQSQSEKSSILYLLNNFQYDSMSMDLMLREGLLPVLISELDTYLSSDDDYHKRKREEKLQNMKKRKLQREIYEQSQNKMAKVTDCESPSSSPRSYASLASPCSSRCMSPIGSSSTSFKLEDAASDDETYSPVCSDDDDDDEDNDANAANDVQPSQNPDDIAMNTNNNLTSSNADASSEIMRLLDIATQSSEAVEDNMLDKEDDEELSQDVPTPKLPQLGNMSRNTLDILENLLFRVSLLINKRGELGKPETMNTLIKAINVFGVNNNFTNSLTNILQESQFFAQVIHCGIAHKLYQLTKNDDLTIHKNKMNRDGYGFMDTLTCVGESNYGKAELARFLRGENEAAQKRAAITVAYIIKSYRLLYQFLNEGNALSLLLQMILCGKRDEFTAQAVDALTSMSKNTLGISVPRLNEISRANEKFEIFVDDDARPLHSDSDMRFVVHMAANRNADGESNTDAADIEETVEFNKELLCNTSEVFNTMLNSDFREKNEGEIHLHSCSVSGLRYFLNLITRRAEDLKYNIPTVNKYYALLEAFEMSRVYIIPEMENFLQQALIGLLDETNCLNVLEWSMRNYHVELTETAINYYLCSTLPTEAKVQLFHKADYSDFSNEWFQMIIDAIFTRCRNGL